MKKVLCGIVILTVLLGLLAGCQAGEGTLLLSPEMEKEIKQAYFEAYIKSDEYKTPEEANISESVTITFFGEYDGAYALFMDDGWREYPAGSSNESVDGVEFEYPVMRKMYVYSDGTFCYGLQEAFDKGLLSSGDVRALHDNFIKVTEG